MLTDDEFSTMRDIGADYGLTSHDLGRYLLNHGFRTADKKPSAKAFESEMVRQRYDGSGHYCWAWHVGKTRLFLEAIGRQRRQGNEQTMAE